MTITPRSLLPQLIAGFFLGMAVLYSAHVYLAPLERFSRAADVSLPPIATVEPAESDLRAVERGQRFEAQFQVRNQGGRRLILRRVDRGCDCAAAGEREIMVEPGGRHTVTVRFERHGALQLRDLEVAYQTNDPRQPMLRLPVAVEAGR